MKQTIAAITYIVRDYDEAVDFFVGPDPTFNRATLMKIIVTGTSGRIGREIHFDFLILNLLFQLSKTPQFRRLRFFFGSCCGAFSGTPESMRCFS